MSLDLSNKVIRGCDLQTVHLAHTYQQQTTGLPYDCYCVGKSQPADFSGSVVETLDPGPEPFARGNYLRAAWEI